MADNEIEDGGLTNEPESGSIHDILARALEASGEDAPPDVEDGPEDNESTGELPAESTDGAADSDEPQADPAAPVADEEPPPVEQEDEPEVASLRDLALTSQESVNKLLEIHAKDLAERQKPKAAEVPRVSEEALHLALHGRPEDEEAWKALPASTRAAATKAAREHLARETRYALDPKARYQDIRQAALEDVAELVRPLIDDYHRRQAEDAYREVAGSITEAGDKKRLAEIYKAVPGQKANVAEQREALKLAVLKLEVEKQTALLAKDRQKIDAKKRDRAAVDAAKNKNASGRRVPSGGNQTKDRPKVSSPADVFGDSFQDYLRNLGG